MSCSSKSHTNADPKCEQCHICGVVVQIPIRHVDITQVFSRAPNRFQLTNDVGEQRYELLFGPVWFDDS
jgi:hypothetical protein